MMNFSKRNVASYALMPQIAPRLKALVSQGFSNLAYLIALVYGATNLLPKGHAYLNSDNFGKYTIHNVFTEAARNIVFDLKHIDQIIIFFALIAGIFILAFQFLFLIIAIFVSPVKAGPLDLDLIDEFFVTENPEQDIALRILDSVFGIPDIFNSQEPKLQPFHEALHALFQIYSFGLLVVAVIILIYFIFAIIAETAQTGTPFGKRYNHVWAPIRLVVGIGMLVPMTFGLNAGQWITLYSAKFGSGFATSGWTIFNETLGADNQAIDPETLVATPKTPSLKDMVAFLSIAKACKFGFELKSEIDNIDAWVVNDAGDGRAQPLSELDYFTALTDLSEGRDIYIRFGQEAPQHNGSMSGVHPYCGNLVLQNTETYEADSPGQIINEAYFDLIKEIWTQENYQNINDLMFEYMNRRLSRGDAPDPPAVWKIDFENQAKDAIRLAINDAVDEARENGFDPDTSYQTLGWGSAALWYNQIANANGKVTSAAMNKPQLKSMPTPMEYTCSENEQQNTATSFKNCYDPNLAKAKQVQYLSTLDENVASGLAQLFAYWYKNSDDITGNAFIDVVNTILGTQGLFDMCQNADIHPLAQLSTLGKGMVEAAVRNLGLSLGSGAAGILAGFGGPALNAASSFFSTVATIGILIGFILFYIVPFMPFLYFFFAIGGWVKGIFEAMVGVPLWALAHLRIDGEGLPGDGAINGYFLIFEIFIRPILIIFGLIASILIFGAMVKVLNQIFTLAVSNVSGFSSEDAGGICSVDGRSIQNPGSIEWIRGPIDELFFTVIYAIIVYMVGMSSFKLIDLIPNNILRWMGQGLQTFNDQKGETADGLVSKLAIGGTILSGNLDIVKQGKTAVTQSGAGIASLARQYGQNG